ncbi:MAG: hypothetical protein COX02_00645 [Candidatus Vogelbacteria bacterium CG22_combo_CG10-13_8_21_14_all_37_9]|uniref:PKD domain-containing protein n=1 Tax=Candidatus Vogelbacteria bacterium CG22_combo_CG10-13_8_21_14_all_37_9 TaxID=1975046 RepID=A0A2H0BMX8_9BACT|nr:MAG: hypothetical protein COX02_00645 [Candidatus Vogelbacteria bacterium CG22_combo_CG10-13_8_21_14_all_37_9]
MKILRVSLVALALLVLASSAVYAAGLTITIVSPTPSTSVNIGQTLNLQASAASAVGGVNYVWSFNDGTASIGGQNQTIAFTTAGTKVVTLTARDGSSSTDVKTVSVTVNSVAPSALTISNVQATGVTTSGVTITWTTNLPATSRVIYDTASHAGTINPNVGGPNYTYTNSTTADSALVTSHSVTISGLTANTQYYFRVISTN